MAFIGSDEWHVCIHMESLKVVMMIHSHDTAVVRGSTRESTQNNAQASHAIMNNTY